MTAKKSAFQLCCRWEQSRIPVAGYLLACFSSTKAEQTKTHTRECKCSLGSFGLSSSSAILSSYHKHQDHRNSGK